METELPTLPEKQDIVYFLQNSDDNKLIKIGFTNDLKTRMTALQTGNPYTLTVLHTIPGGLRLEQVIHNRFEHLRTNREWFRPEKELLDYIELTKNKEVLQFITQTYHLNFRQVQVETKDLIDQLSDKIINSEFEYEQINLENKVRLLEYQNKVLAKYIAFSEELRTEKVIGEKVQKKWRELRGAVKSCLDRFEKIIVKNS